MSIGIDFGIGIDENSWYRPGIVSKPKKLVSPIPTSNVNVYASNVNVSRANKKGKK